MISAKNLMTPGAGNIQINLGEGDILADQVKQQVNDRRKKLLQGAMQMQMQQQGQGIYSPNTMGASASALGSGN